MTVGEVFLESLRTGVITEAEIGWLTTQQASFNRTEEAAVLRLGRLIDAGTINLGCRIPSLCVSHQSIALDWIEPLGHKRNSPRYE